MDTVNVGGRRTSLKGGSFHTLFMFLREDLAMTGVVTLTAEMR